MLVRNIHWSRKEVPDCIGYDACLYYWLLIIKYGINLHKSLCLKKNISANHKKYYEFG
jgi:hypothetical protein